MFGDASARGVAAGLLDFAKPGEFSIYGEIHADYSIPQMADGIFQLTTDFTWQDNVIVCIDLGSIGGVGSYLLNKLFSIGKYTNLVFSLTYSSSNYNRYFNFVSLCQRFLKYHNASIRTLDNNIVGGKFRLTKKSLCKNIYIYASVSFVLRSVFVSSCVRYCDIAGVVARGVVEDIRLPSNRESAGDNREQGSFLG